jgi:hypothetical protein
MLKMSGNRLNKMHSFELQKRPSRLSWKMYEAFRRDLGTHERSAMIPRNSGKSLLEAKDGTLGRATTWERSLRYGMERPRILAGARRVEVRRRSCAKSARALAQLFALRVVETKSSQRGSFPLHRRKSRPPVSRQLLVQRIR